MTVLSLFDGISCAQIVISELFDKYTYYASEVDVHAINITMSNFPNTIQLGDVRNIKNIDFEVDLLIGGSPCQDLSVANSNRIGLDGKRSSLFWEYYRILKSVKPKHFLLENVASMKKEDRNKISEMLGVEPTMINSEIFSAQQRKRLYWTNIKFELPDKQFWNTDTIQDVLEDAKVDDKFYLDEKAVAKMTIIKAPASYKTGNKRGPMPFPNRLNKKSLCLLTSNVNSRIVNFVKDSHGIRRLTALEYERLQTLPEGYTATVSDTQRFKSIGNSFNVKTIRYILSHMKHPEIILKPEKYQHEN